MKGMYTHCICFLTPLIMAKVVMRELKPLTNPPWGTVLTVVWLEGALDLYPKRTQGTGSVQVPFYIF